MTTGLQVHVSVTDFSSLFTISPISSPIWALAFLPPQNHEGQRPDCQHLFSLYAAAPGPCRVPPTRPFIRSLVRPDRSSLKPSCPHEDARAWAFPRVARQLSPRRCACHISHIKWLSAELWCWAGLVLLRSAVWKPWRRAARCPAFLPRPDCCQMLFVPAGCGRTARSLIPAAVNTHTPRRMKCKQAKWLETHSRNFLQSSRTADESPTSHAQTEPDQNQSWLSCQCRKAAGDTIKNLRSISDQDPVQLDGSGNLEVQFSNKTVVVCHSSWLSNLKNDTNVASSQHRYKDGQKHTFYSSFKMYYN